jgi:hypothetical protein
VLAGRAVADERPRAALVRRFQHRPFELAMTMVGHHGRADDIAPEAVLRDRSVAAALRGRRFGELS